jgi:hypothetical protein
MKAKIFSLFLVASGIIVSASERTTAISISLQYPAGNLFSATLDPTANAAINAAAADISTAITSSLNVINTDVYTGTNGSTSAIFDWFYTTTNPATGFDSEIFNATIPANNVIIQIGARNLTGSTLGIGGPAAMGFQLSGSGFPNQWVGAIASAEFQSESAYRRGSGPILGTLSGSIALGNTTANYSVDYGIAYGSVSLDWDGNNNGVKDSDAELNDYWHFDHTTAVASGKRDLYSVALHEILHALGVGASASWDSKVAGTSWTGLEVIGVHGTGSNLVTLTGDHIAEGIMSTRATDGVPQEVAMDPTVATGARKYLTALDLAFLRDIGYTTIVPAPAVPEPNALALLFAAGMALIGSRHR